MADSGKAEILATVSSNKHELVAPSIDVINTYFGRPELPIGAPKTAGVNLGSSQHWADSIVEKYPHKTAATSEVPDAVDIYRKILSNQPDKSVTIVTVGFLTNLNNLLKSQPDNISPLSGKELVTKKVESLFQWPESFLKEGNSIFIWIQQHQNMFMKTGRGKSYLQDSKLDGKSVPVLRLIKSDIKNSPVKDVFRISIPLSAEDKDGRMSWDETAVLIGVYGTEGFFDTQRENYCQSRWQQYLGRRP